MNSFQKKTRTSERSWVAWLCHWFLIFSFMANFCIRFTIFRLFLKLNNILVYYLMSVYFLLILQLLWIILLASCAALVIQSLAANLGVVTGLLFLWLFIFLLVSKSNIVLYDVMLCFCRKASSWALSTGVSKDPELYFVVSRWNCCSRMWHSGRLGSLHHINVVCLFKLEPSD